MIETQRLILRPYELADYAPYCGMVCGVTPDSFPSAQPISREDAWHRVMRYAGHWALLGFGLFAVIEKASGNYVGETGLADFHRGMGSDFDGSDEAAWYFVADRHRQGYAYEAAQAAHEWHAGRRGPH
jgi:RimJ/RimL family protein N-acetyltransferase